MTLPELVANSADLLQSIDAFRPFPWWLARPHEVVFEVAQAQENSQCAFLPMRSVGGADNK